MKTYEILYFKNPIYDVEWDLPIRTYVDAKNLNEARKAFAEKHKQNIWSIDLAERSLVFYPSVLKIEKHPHQRLGQFLINHLGLDAFEEIDVPDQVSHDLMDFYQMSDKDATQFITRRLSKDQQAGKHFKIVLKHVSK